MGEQPLRERDTFATIYKHTLSALEHMVMPLVNLSAPEVAQHVRDVPYVTEPSNKKQRLDVIRPLGKGPFPVLVFVHGGGWISMDKSYYTRMCKVFAAAGYLVLNINYRRAPHFRYPINISDVGAAVAWALENAAAYGGDPSVMFLAGDSAGAHLVSTYSTALSDGRLARAFKVDRMKRPSRLTGLVLFYGAFDLETLAETGFPFVRMMLRSFLSRDPVLFRQRAQEASPLRHISPTYPPCFICYSLNDPLHTESEAFARELELEGVEHDVLAVPRGECRLIPHGFVMIFWRKCAKRAMEAAIGFLDAKKDGRESPVESGAV